MLLNSTLTALESLSLIVSEGSVSQRDELRTQMKQISHHIDAPERPEDELAYINDLQIDGSCGWLPEKSAFQDWQFEQPQDDSAVMPRVLWLSGKPGTGKSVMAGHIVKYLEECNADCSYYFFKHNNKKRSTISALLRSLAYQMAETNFAIRQELLAMARDGEYFNKDDERSVWKILFTSRIFCLEFCRPQYWIIDALDECTNYTALFPLLSKMDKLLPIRLLITSRPLPSVERLFTQEKLEIIAESISEEDTLQDIRLFLQARADFLPVEDDQARLDLTENIVQKSNGSFLWASLISKELEMTHSEQQVADVLSQVPTEMDDVYTRILAGIQALPRNQTLAKAIFRWTVCAARPLSIAELKEALRLDTGHVIPRLENVVSSITGCLVDVGADGKVQVVHETVKSFLTRSGLESEYAVDKRREQSRLAEICLQYLCGNELQPARRGSTGRVSKPSEISVLAEYATRYFSFHLAESSSAIDKPLMLLDQLLRTNVLGWIEFVARAGDLDVLLQTSRNLKAYLDRRAKYRSPLGKEVQRAEAWADDFIRIVAAFGKNITSLPESVQFLVPAVSPPKSMIHREFKGVSRSLEVVGSSEEDWDDRISCIVYPEGQALCVTSWESRFAVGLSTGSILLYKTTTFQGTRTLSHGEPVRHLCFAIRDDLLASCGRKKLVLWDPQTGAQLWTASLNDLVLGTSFTQDDDAVMIATRGNKMLSFDTRTGARLPDWSYFDMNNSEDDALVNRKQPTHISISSELNLLAIAYRQRPISFWDLEDNSWLSHFHKGDPNVYPGPLLVGVTINPNPDLELAAAAYQDGDLVVFNPFDGQQKASVEASAHVLVSSPDGRTLATGDGNGMIQLFNFETLRLLYRVSMYDYDIRNLAFTSDSLRFFDIRSNQCNIWEPTVLVRGRDVDDTTSEPYSDEVPHPALVVDCKSLGNEETITAICEHHSGGWIFAGRENGSVAVFNVSTGKQAEELIKPMVISVKLLAWSNSCNWLAIADTSSRVTVRSITVSGENRWDVASPILSVRADQPIQQLFFNQSGRLLLVSTNALDEIWDVEHAVRIGARPRTNSTTSCRWVNHPGSEDQVLLVEAGYAYVYNWASLSRLSRPEGIKLSGSGSHESSVDHTLTSRSGRNLCVRFLKPSELNFAELQIYLASSIDPKAECANPIAGYTELAGRIKTVIGIYKSYVLFLDVDGWICSLNIDSFVVEGHYSRHFFIPLSWYNVGDMCFAVTVNGSVALARRDEVIVFHHGLDFFDEQIPLDPAKNGGTAVTGKAAEGQSTATSTASGVKLSRRRRPGPGVASRTIRSDPGPA